MGGAVGVTVTVRTWPVIVSSEMMGVGVQVFDVDDDDDSVVSDEEEVLLVDCWLSALNK